MVDKPGNHIKIDSEGKKRHPKTHMKKGFSCNFALLKLIFDCNSKNNAGFTSHNSPIYDECQTQSAWVLALPRKQAHQDNSNDTRQPICEFQVSFPLLRIRINQDKP